METANSAPDQRPQEDLPASRLTSLVPGDDVRPVLIEPDLSFINNLSKQCGETFVKCFQCGTCGATCALSPDREPFPRKEMIWAAWGWKDRLLKDPDIWLCHQCNDCTVNCPRGARPGDVLAAIRQQCVAHYSFPRFLARWVGQPQSLLLLVGIATILLTLALLLRGRLEGFFGITYPVDEAIIFPYSSAFFPRWLLNGFFFSITGLVLLVATIGVVRFWKTVEVVGGGMPATSARPGLLQSVVTVVKNIITHEKFSQCTQARSRSWSHMLVFFGFLALTVVTLWVITIRVNPLLTDGFAYPFDFWSPWKLWANLGGAAVLSGCLWMIWERLRDAENGGSNYFDWSFVGLLLLVVGSGFFTEVLHYVRLEPHRHIVYFGHLVLAGTLIMYLPYSKFAHVIYRTAAMVHAEYTGRGLESAPDRTTSTPDGMKEGLEHG
ncbi:MAG: quinone-interacting membrane-bound oxidoreductase complex subunit QmoC [bacterium]